MQHVPSVPSDSFDICSPEDQHLSTDHSASASRTTTDDLCDVRVPETCCEMEWRPPLVLNRVYIRSVAHQNLSPSTFRCLANQNDKE